MKIKTNNSNFEPCPEFTGKAVCVDVTPLRKQQSQYRRTRRVQDRVRGGHGTG